MPKEEKVKSKRIQYFRYIIKRVKLRDTTAFAVHADIPSPGAICTYTFTKMLQRQLATELAVAQQLCLC